MSSPFDDDAEIDDSTQIINLKDLAAVNTPTELAPILTAIAGRAIGRTYHIQVGENLVGRKTDLAIVVVDEGISRRHTKIVCNTDNTCILTDLGSTNGTFIGAEKVDRPILLQEGDCIHIGAESVLRFGYKDAREAEMQERLYNAATCDPLTGAFNRRYLNQSLSTEWPYARRWRQPCAVVMFDLDHFKNVNDTYGHLAGDKVLITVSATVASCIRSEDIFARIGGEEFVVLARNTALKHALILAERLRYAIEKAVCTFEGQPIPVTASFGVSISSDVDTVKALMAQADEALYEAKRAGRNRVFTHSNDDDDLTDVW